MLLEDLPPTYVLPRVTQHGRLRLASGEELDGTVYLMPDAERHTGAETPAEMLNRVERFFPFRPESGTGVLLVAKSQTLWLATAANGADEDSEPPAYDTTVGLDVALDDGTTLSGTAAFALPQPGGRVLDYLNVTPDRFFTLAAPGARYCVNRHHVRYARPHDEGQE